MSSKAAVTIQDSCYEVQKLLLQENERPARSPCTRSKALLEQEKQRNLEKQREELAVVQRLQGRLRQEQQRWERECDLRRRQQGEEESRLEQREHECLLQAEQLQRERGELEGQLREYQQSLERLREGRRTVERERERLETQQRLLQSWKHSHQSNLPITVTPLDHHQGSNHKRSDSFDAESSALVNEVNFPDLQTSLNNHHIPQGHVFPSPENRTVASSHNSLNALIAHANQKQADSSQHHHDNHWTRPIVLQLPEHHHNNHRTEAIALQLPEFISQTAVAHRRDRTINDVNTRNCDSEETSVEEAVGGSGGYQCFMLPSASCPHTQSYVSLETENGEDRGEENIVYL